MCDDDCNLRCMQEAAMRTCEAGHERRAHAGHHQAPGEQQRSVVMQRSDAESRKPDAGSRFFSVRPLMGSLSC